MSLKTQGSLRRLWPYIKNYRLNFVLVLGLVIVTVSIDLVQPYLVKEAIDRYLAVEKPNAEAILWMTAVYLVLTLLSFGFSYYQNVVLQYTAQRIVRAIRVDLFSHIQLLSMSFFDRNAAGRIVTNVVNDTEVLNTFFTQFLMTMLQGGFSLVLIMFMMLQLDVTIALYCFMLIPIIAVLSFLFQRVLRKVYNDVRNRLSNAIIFLAENLSGMSVIQIFHQEAKQSKKFDDRNKALLKSSQKEIRLTVTFFQIMELIGDLMVAALVWIGGRAVLGETITFGVLYAFISYIRRFFQPINTITQQLNVLQSAIVATDRIVRMLQETPDIEELPGALTPPVRGQVRFEHVSFAYTPGQTILNDIHLTVQPGERIGFVGASGAGKSSLMNLLTRFYDTTEGTVRIDGKDVKEWPLTGLSRTIGIVQQDVTLFSGAVIDNIRFFRKGISDEQVRTACKLVGAERFILRLPEGYSTVLSERAGTLSAGEKQLLSFARALVFDPRVLILDEATASLDSETESVLQEAIREVSRGRTMFVVAHRLSTIRDMNRIVVLDQGKIVETGTHDELLLRQGYYWRLYQAGLLVQEEVG